MMGSLMAAPSESVAKEGVGAHQGKAAEAEGEKCEIEHGVLQVVQHSLVATLPALAIKSRW